MKVINFISLMFFALLFFSCQKEDASSVYFENENFSVSEKKRMANETIEKAKESFFALIPETEKDNATGFTLKERVMGASWDAYYSGDDSEFKELLKENGLYDDFLEICEKYDLKTQQEYLSQKNTVLSSDSKKNVEASFFDQFVDGDIFVCYGYESFIDELGTIFTPGRWKHSGMMDKHTPWQGDRNICILSASRNTTHGFAVGYETREKWTHNSTVAAVRVKGWTAEAARKAVEYCQPFIGADYSVFTGKENENLWYCSKIVYKAWQSQGVDLEPTKWDAWVTPTDLYNDGDTYLIAGNENVD